MIRLAILALILAGCGGHSHHAAKPPTTPPSTAFADIAGTYTATVIFGTGQPYDAVPNGTEYTFTIVADGTLTVSGGSSAAVYHLTRNADGTFKTDGRSIAGGLTEFGSAPANLSTCTLRSLKLWAGFTDQGTLYGSEDLALVKNAGG
jgi:hypothetical protein